MRCHSSASDICDPSYRAAIGKLRADNEALKEEMQVENKFSVRPTSSAAAATIESLRQQSDACTQKVTPDAASVANATHQYKIRTAIATNLPHCICGSPHLLYTGPVVLRMRLQLLHLTQAALAHRHQYEYGHAKVPGAQCRPSAQIGTERARVADLQRRAAQAQAQVEEQRRKMGGLRAAQDCDIQVLHLPILPMAAQMWYLILPSWAMVLQDTESIECLLL